MFNRNEYQIEYRKKNLKRVSLELPIKDYEKIKQHTENTSESINGFIKRAINETMERDVSESSKTPSVSSTPGFPEVSSAPSE